MSQNPSPTFTGRPNIGIFLDTETGGLDASRDGLIDIHAAIFDLDAPSLAESISHEFSATIRLDGRYRYQPSALRINGAKLSDLLNAEDVAAAYDRFANFLECAVVSITGSQPSGPSEARKVLFGRVWAHHASFDYGFIQQFARRANGLPVLPPEEGEEENWGATSASDFDKTLFGPRVPPWFSCSKALYRGLSSLGVLPSGGDSLKSLVTDLARRGEIEPFDFRKGNGTHGAGEDVRAGIAVLRYIRQKVSPPVAVEEVKLPVVDEFSE